MQNLNKTRQKLLQATIDLVTEKGEDALSLKEAAEVAKVSRSLAYYHFEDREHLLREAKSWLANQLVESIKQIDSRTTEEHVHYTTSLVLNNLQASTRFFTDSLVGKDFDRQHPLYKMTFEMLEQQKANGEIRNNIDIEILSFFMLGSMSTLIMLSHFNDGEDNEALAKRYTTEWMRILRYGIYADNNKTGVTSTPKSKINKRAKTKC